MALYNYLTDGILVWGKDDRKDDDPVLILDQVIKKGKTVGYEVFICDKDGVKSFNRSFDSLALAIRYFADQIKE